MKGGLDFMYRTGEKPGRGSYTCISCGRTVEVDDNSEALKSCPSCGCTTFNR